MYRSIFADTTQGILTAAEDSEVNTTCMRLAKRNIMLLFRRTGDIKLQLDEKRTKLLVKNKTKL